MAVRSIRARLTLAYAGALFGTMVLFALVLLVARRQAALREVDAFAVEELERVKQIILQTRTTSVSPVETRTSFAPGSPDSALFRGPGVTAQLKRYLDLIDEYIVVRDSAGEPLYRSRRVEELPIDDRGRLEGAVTALTDGASRRVALRTGDVLLRATDVPQLTNNRIRRVWVGVSLAPAVLAPRELVGAMLLVAPFLLAASVAGAYAIAARAFRPVDRMIDQVEAITDGRSLHRRLAIGQAGDELTRLAVTLNQMIERLETSFGALRRFTADASHELKTPLAVLRADVERAMSERTKASERAVALEEALEQITRMADLVDSLLTLARADEGRLEVVHRPVSLGPLVREVYETARLLGEAGSLDIRAPRIDEADVTGDVTRLRQLLLNLVTNAIKYTPAGGRVELSLAVQEGAAVFTVRDTGVGIAAADLPYIFERFWRADRARSRGGTSGGFGLGLAISQWIAQAHGGTLTCQSRLGRGTVFTLTVPLAGDVPPGGTLQGSTLPGSVPSESVPSGSAPAGTASSPAAVASAPPAAAGPTSA